MSSWRPHVLNSKNFKVSFSSKTWRSHACNDVTGKVFTYQQKVIRSYTHPIPSSSPTPAHTLAHVGTHDSSLLPGR